MSIPQYHRRRSRILSCIGVNLKNKYNTLGRCENTEVRKLFSDPQLKKGEIFRMKIKLCLILPVLFNGLEQEYFPEDTRD